ncbi:unnamed protein product [Prorocentrum cordatum]|uniref:Acyltransferase 3 domain-containing protein n=1 Tax=Prorocentrum cordatum TaxID=2364126 RepID=A0ABN9YBX6_9DINO|nr:unnamed protein product [Polarella glacialis]
MATAHGEHAEARAHVLGKGVDEESEAPCGDEEAVLVTASSPGHPATKGEQPVNISRFDTLDGLRGIGCLLVVAYHLRLGVNSAWICIGVFFSLSGFLMTSQALRTQAKHGEFNVFIFWKRRVARLIPALMLTVASIACATLIEKAITGEQDPIASYYLRKDLLYTIAYGQNWNLISQQQDYFSDPKPSVVRHVWSLSIEEQYYILWPLLFQAIQRAATFVTASKGRESSVPEPDPAMSPSMSTPAMRFLLKALLSFELVAITFSQYICKYVYETQGGSAAYYASWTRAGEFAVGGLVACCFHLSPWINEQISRSPERPPMSTLLRITLEVAGAVAFVTLVGCSMISVPQDVLMDHYVRWLRLPVAFVITFCAIAQVLQTSEPLPPWAIFTKFAGSRSLGAADSVVSYHTACTSYIGFS